MRWRAWAAEALRWVIIAESRNLPGWTGSDKRAAVVAAVAPLLPRYVPLFARRWAAGLAVDLLVFALNLLFEKDWLNARRVQNVSRRLNGPAHENIYDGEKPHA